MQGRKRNLTIEGGPLCTMQGNLFLVFGFWFRYFPMSCHFSTLLSLIRTDITVASRDSRKGQDLMLLCIFHVRVFTIAGEAENVFRPFTGEISAVDHFPMRYATALPVILGRFPDFPAHVGGLVVV